MLFRWRSAQLVHLVQQLIRSARPDFERAMGCASSQSTVPSYNPTETRGLSTAVHNSSNGATKDHDAGGKPFDVDVCAISDMRDGEMREVALKKDTSALLVKDRGIFYAVGSKCTHYGAPLAKGALCNGRVRCPWHGACFRLDTGDIEEFPGLDSLPRYEVLLDQGRVKIRADSSQLGVVKRVRPMRIAMPDNDDLVVIIGSGAAGATAAETLRQEGYEGRLVMLSKDSAAPYDRTKLSKAMDAKLDAIRLRDEHFYSVYDIELRLGAEVVRVDANAHLVHLRDGATQDYTKLLIASGVVPRRLTVPGSDLDGVHYLRDLSSAQRLAAAAGGRRVVVLGSSFIAMEAAAFLVSAGKAKTVTVVMRGDVPFKSSFGAEVGAALMRAHAAKGVEFVANDSVDAFEGSSGRLESVVLASRRRLAADVCLPGLGSTSTAPDFLAGSQLELDDAGYVRVSERMETSHPSVYAAGDVASFPLVTFGARRVRIGHWHMAQQHGRVAALNMLGRQVDLSNVPYFWSVLFGKSIRFCGYTEGYSDVVLHGDLDKPEFVAFYLQDEKVVGAASMNFDPVVSQVAEMMASKRTISRHEIAEDPRGFVKRLGAGARG